MTTQNTRAIWALLAVVMGAGFSPVSAAGQATPSAGAPPSRDERRATVFGSIGNNSQTDDESNLGKGVGFSGDIAFPLTRKLAAGVEVTRLAHRRELTYWAAPADPRGAWLPVSAELTGTATYVLGQLTYVFSRSRVQPFVSGSYGVMRYSGTPWGSVLPGPQPVAVPTRFQTTAAAMGGTGGVNVAVGGGVWVGPQVGVFAAGTGEAGTKLALHGGIRAGYDW